MLETARKLSQYRVRPMLLEDVDQVSAIEALCFPLPWPAESYRRDIRYGGPSRYIVAEWMANEPRIAGFAGCWLIEDEVHISTLAVHPDHRSIGLGEYLLASLLRLAIERNASTATLEVRVSNFAAQSLYLKYGFRITGRRRRYYRDNGEDAFIMTIESLDGEKYLSFFQRRWQRLMAQREEQHKGSLDE